MGPLGELGALFNPGMRHEMEERRQKQMLREEEGTGRKGNLRIDLESGVAVIAGSSKARSGGAPESDEHLESNAGTAFEEPPAAADETSKSDDAPDSDETAGDGTPDGHRPENPAGDREDRPGAGGNEDRHGDGPGRAAKNSGAGNSGAGNSGADNSGADNSGAGDSGAGNSAPESSAPESSAPEKGSGRHRPAGGRHEDRPAVKPGEPQPAARSAGSVPAGKARRRLNGSTTAPSPAPSGKSRRSR